MPMSERNNNDKIYCQYTIAMSGGGRVLFYRFILLISENMAVRQNAFFPTK